MKPGSFSLSNKFVSIEIARSNLRSTKNWQHDQIFREPKPSSTKDSFMELLIVQLQNIVRYRPQLTVWFVSKISFVSGNLAIKGGHKDLNNLTDL